MQTWWYSSSDEGYFILFLEPISARCSVWAILWVSINSTGLRIWNVFYLSMPPIHYMRLKTDIDIVPCGPVIRLLISNTSDSEQFAESKRVKSVGVVQGSSSPRHGYRGENPAQNSSAPFWVRSPAKHTQGACPLVWEGAASHRSLFNFQHHLKIYLTNKDIYVIINLYYY